MTSLQAAAIISLTAAGAWRILFFDTRGRTHKPLICFIAWLKFAWMMGLMIAVIFKLYSAAMWGLIFGLALHTGALIWHGGNVNSILPTATKHQTNP